MSNPVVFDGKSLEARLSDLIDLAGKVEARINATDGPDLLDALREARAAIAERIRAVVVDLQKPTFRIAPADAAALKVGGEVWIRGQIVDFDQEDHDDNRPFKVSTDDGNRAASECWPSLDRLFAWKV